MAGLLLCFGGCSVPQFEFRGTGDDQDGAGAGGADAAGGKDPGPGQGDGTCRDTIRNQDETDVDCGGLECPPCPSGNACKLQADCREGVCEDNECRLPECTDGVLNGTETDVDCGDICAPCLSGMACAEASDCEMLVCTDGVCQDESCGDQVENGDETDVDCGGSCKKCDDGLVCSSSTDCVSGVCDDGAGKPNSIVHSDDPTLSVCQPPACDDEVLNGDETDVDCGGSCTGCEVSENCSQPTDCLSQICTSNQCQAPDCTDEVKNGTESDIDCGGAGCADCITGKACALGDDCASGSCGNGVCLDPVCPDNVANGTETDVDCGGPNCPKCGPDLACDGPGDCDSNHCVGGFCQEASCEDGVLNQDETDVDCGGSCPKRCDPDMGCLGAIDCASNVCTAGFCVDDSCSDGVTNGAEADIDCGNLASGCPLCRVGAACTLGNQCVNSVCTDGFCQAAGCGDYAQNGDETDVDCGGGQCASCDPDDACGVPSDCTSQVCASSVCQTPTCADAIQNSVESDVDCGGGFCPQCETGEKCFAANDCNSLVCTSAVCRDPTCLDKVQNQGESDVDCGGLACTKCAPGKSCALPDDCSSLVCTGGRCQTPSCSDVVRNGYETDIDCGGPSCFKCDIGKGCALGVDCTSGVCSGGLCQAPSCFDGVKNGNEIDVDCGGACGKCGTNQACSGPSDCQSSVCTNGKCAAPVCSDMVRNAVETDVDCGGGTCLDCGNGKTCWLAGDCVSGVCVSNICQVPSCTDVVKNGVETDVDCGGANQCSRCAEERLCGSATDCASGVCSGSPKKCQAAACPDGVENGNETDIDCGGGSCPKCEITEGCDAPADCVSGVCTNDQCAAPLCTDVVKNGSETDVDCGGTCPDKCAAGKACSVAADCQAGLCTNNFCQSASCNDGLHNGDETDVDCGGSCAKCADSKKCSVAGDCSSSVCSGSPQKTCQVPTCADIVKNGGESAIDCGGSSSCSRCAGGLSCTAGSDCVSGICSGNLCSSSSCSDGVKNGTETDVDCGGSCGSKCADLKGCGMGTDCVSGVCSGNICQVPACNDSTTNGVETDIDCGGSVSCPDCGTGKRCSASADCLDGVCTGNPKKCAAASCSDVVKNGTESDVDCGGSCAKCVDTKLCNTAADCQSAVCSGTPKRCQVPSCTDLAKNGTETDVDCGGASCSKCAASKACLAASDCQSAVCTGNICQNNTCSDSVKNGTETDVDCGGGCAPGTRCVDGKVCTINGDCLSNSCVSNVCQPTAGSSLKIQARQGDSYDTDGQIRPWIKIVNTGATAVALSNLKVRYWYTADKAVAQEHACDWSTFGCGNMTRAVVPVSPVKDKADYYLELSFSTAAGNVPAGGEVDIQVRVNGYGWPNLTESNDYSFTNSTSFADRSKITLYSSGALVWGTEPPAYTNQGLYLQYRATTTSSTATDLLSQWRLYNPDPIAIPLSEITMRYWYTYDGAAGTQVADTGTTDLTGGYSANRVLTSYVSDSIGSTSRTSADRFYEVGFTSSAGDLYWNDYVTVQARYHTDTFASMTQTNDYSFDATKTAFANWSKITVYRNGTLVWGTEPALVLRDPENPSNTSQGLLYKYYQGTGWGMPTFSSLNPTTTGTTSNFDLSKAEQGDYYALRFTGYINVPTDGAYTFYTSSDDGSKLFIGTTEVVNNDGVHPSQERSGTIGLKAGKHAIRVEYFEANGGEVLEVRYSGPSIAKQLIPNSALFKTPCENASYVYCEDFEDGNANGWTQLYPYATPGSWAVVSSSAPVFAASDVFAQTYSGDTEFRFNYVTPTGGPWGDQTVTAWIKPTVWGGSSLSYKVGVCARFTGAATQANTTGYCLYLRTDGVSGSGRLQMMEKTSGTNNATGLAEATTNVPQFNTGTWYKVTLKVSGTSTVTLTGYINDVQRIQTTDSAAPFATGYPALTTRGVQAQFEDVFVTTP